MLMNNGQGTRSYSPVPQENRANSPKEDPRDRLKVLVRNQIAHEILAALTISDLTESYWKMGLVGHKYKMCHLAKEEFEENFDWRKYYHILFEEEPRIQIEYVSPEPAKSLDEIHNRLYELHMKNKANLQEILKISSEEHMYSDMKHLLKAYQKCEKHEKKLEQKAKLAQMFGYDVAHIMAKDEELYCKYKKDKDRSYEK